MPLTGSYKPAPLPSANAQPEVSPIRKWLAGGTRVLSGWGASIPAMEPGLGSALGAGIAGLGEAAAEKIEGSPLNESRIALEAGLGAVPLSRVFRAGRAAQSAIRSGALSGVGEAGRELSQGEDLSPGSVVTATGLGALMGGVLGKFSIPKAKAATKTYEVQQAGKPQPQTKSFPSVRGETPTQPPVAASGREGYWAKQGLNPPAAPGKMASAQSELPFMSEAPGGKVPFRNEGPSTPYRAAGKAALRADEKAAIEAEKALAEEERLTQIEEAQAGMKAGQPTVSESISAKTPEGVSKRLSTKFKVAGEEGDEGGVAPDLGRLISGGSRKGPKINVPETGPAREIYDAWVQRGRTPAQASKLAAKGRPPVSILEEEAPQVAEAVAPATAAPVEGALAPGVSQTGSLVEESPLARLFKSRVDAAGQGYRDIKTAIGAGEKVPEEGRQIAGKALRQEGQAAGLPMTSPRTQVPQGAPLGPVSNKGNIMEVGPQGELFPGKKEWNQVSELEQVVNELKARGVAPEDIQRNLPAFYDRIKSAGGEIDPEFLARIGMTGVGALTGGLVGGAVGHPFAGMAIGAVGGALSPSAIKSGLDALGAHPTTTDNLAEKISTPEGVKETAKTIMSTLPQVQRFNYLMDTFGLPTNAWVGPYGSAMMAGIESHLSGDPRGMALLKKLTPQRFASEWKMAEDEAKRRISEGELGRAETALLGHGKASEVLQWPGVMMTSGDLASRNILMEAGFTGDEARRITLTSEPELDTFKKIANFSKGNPLLQMFQPFARTPANIAEQGLQRTPGIGFLARTGESAKDSLQQQLVQQGLGLGAGAVGYEVGQNVDPNSVTGKVTRRVASNIAGQYSLPMSIGLAAGQAKAAGRPVLSRATAAAVSDALPLPSVAQPVSDWLGSIRQGEPPRGAIPSFLYNLLYPPQASSNTLKRMPRMPRLGSPSQ